MAYIVFTEIRRIATEKTLTEEQINTIKELFNKGESMQVVKDFLTASEHDLKDDMESDKIDISILNNDFGDLEKDAILISQALQDLFEHS